MGFVLTAVLVTGVLMMIATSTAVGYTCGYEKAMKKADPEGMEDLVTQWRAYRARNEHSKGVKE